MELQLYTFLYNKLQRKFNGVPALFESREEEIVKRLSKIEQEVEIEFLDELVN